MYLPLAILVSFAFLYSISAGRIEKSPFTGPIIFVSFGILAGPLGFGWLGLEVTATELRVLADLTLALLFVQRGGQHRPLGAGTRHPGAGADAADRADRKNKPPVA